MGVELLGCIGDLSLARAGAQIKIPIAGQFEVLQNVLGLPQRTVDRAFERDPIVAASAWMGEFRSDIQNLFSIEAVEAAVDRPDGPRFGRVV